MKNPFRQLTSSELAGMTVLIASVTGACLYKTCEEKKYNARIEAAEIASDSVTALIKCAPTIPSVRHKGQTVKRSRQSEKAKKAPICKERDYIEERVAPNNRDSTQDESH